MDKALHLLTNFNEMPGQTYEPFNNFKSLKPKHQ